MMLCIVRQWLAFGALGVFDEKLAVCFKVNSGDNAERYETCELLYSNYGMVL